MSNLVNYDELKKTDFFQFFNLHEMQIIRKSELNDLTYIELETGGFQEFINIKLYINNERNIQKAELIMDRSWIGNAENINPFGKDIAKSFIYTMTPLDEKEKIESLSHYLWMLKGLNDNIISIKNKKNDYDDPTISEMEFIDVYRNLLPKAEFKLEDSSFFVENINIDEKEKLIIIWKVIDI